MTHTPDTICSIISKIGTTPERAAELMDGTGFQYLFLFQKVLLRSNLTL